MRGEAGGVLTSGLVKAVVILALVVVVLFDFGAVTVNAIQLDDIAGSSLRVARQSWATTGRLAAAEDAVLDYLEGEEDVTLQELEHTGNELVLTISRPSRTLVAHRISPLETHVERTATKRAEAP